MSLTRSSPGPDVETLGAALARAFEREGADNQWAVTSANPQAAVDQDMTQVQRLLECPDPRPHLRVWRNRRALVVPRFFRNRPGFNAAIAASAVPVALRQSGGTAVMHGPHVLNLSLALPAARACPFRIEEVFGALAEVVSGPLGRLGVDVHMANIARAHCPGRFTLVAMGRKIAGTAAFVREHGDRRVALAHCNLVLAHNRDDLDAIISFEKAVGLAANYLPDAHTSVAEAIPAVV